ncbi:UDP-3-O-(3-hydroxymyristoyl)glucosamine N-acyltransferase [Mongoliibacter ruber]|uniref:UDP-3-O-acylglucosamine N-acyltransferase n=1 Tax=Mongoliibacter ruber TaxID=1750599 RepID=A0A2T0WF38_9BACT|nr:UDP-3-O-(3-hydroxymyristoyl)glucosamine N-acyltransferase [Mongoliibacter ruber]PRY85292.1 UDP-3-O-[3-hydroxymyristoyl] glucosamine N-acyltransferase [Mongoliibacter ruber]
MEFTLGQIATILGGKVEGDENLKVNRLDKIQEGKEGGIGFLANEKYEPHIYTTEATAVIVSEDFRPKSNLPCTLIRVKDAYNGFTTLLEAYAQLTKMGKTGIEEPSFCDSSSRIGDDCYRAAFSYIGKNCSLGNNVKVHAHVSIEDNVIIGDNTILHSGVKIKNGSVIGKNCEIHSGAVIGADGFGFVPQEDGTYKSIPQIGNVIIEDSVSVGSNTTIDCATMGSTIIRKGAKIDNMVQIAHNVVIGENTVIASQTGISGSTIIGKNCIIAGQVGIVGHIKIADNTTIAAKTGISKSIKKPGQTIFGYMGMDIKHFLKSYTIFKNLPQIQDKLKELEKKQ